MSSSFRDSTKNNKEKRRNKDGRKEHTLKDKKPDHDQAQQEQRVHLELPYDDLELLYEYTLQEMGVTGPFKGNNPQAKNAERDKKKG